MSKAVKYLLFLMIVVAFSDMIINEVMISPHTNTEGNQFIEIYNRSDYPIDISRYTFANSYLIRDSITTFAYSHDFPHPDVQLETTIIPPHTFAVILDSDYIFPLFDAPYNFPNGTILLTTKDGDLGSGLRSSNEKLYLYNPEGVMIDSVAFGTSIRGRSFERLSLYSSPTAPISDEGWQRTPAIYGHTVGTYNTTQPVPNNLALDSAKVSDEMLWVYVSNQGEDSVSTGDLDIYYYDIADSIYNHLVSQYLEVETTVELSYDLSALEDGIYRFDINISGDMQPIDNRIDTVFVVGELDPTFEITEINFKPSDGIEWIEFVNVSDSALDISGWRFGDRNAISEISDTTIFVESGQFLVLSQEAISIPDNCDAINVVPTGIWRALNNTADAVVLLDEYSTVVYATYDVPSNFPAGYSIEILCGADVDVADPSSWEMTQFFGGTPGCLNSNCPVANDIAISDAYMVDDILHIVLENVGYQAEATGTLHIYHDRNMDGIASDDELLFPEEDLIISHIYEPSRTIALPEGIHRLIINITGDDRHHNNSDTVMFYNDVVMPLLLTEFMSNPHDGDPEWVELYNHTDDIVDISGWTLGDGYNQKLISDELWLLPSQFLVISENKGGGPNVADTCDAILVVLDSWERLNITSDIIVLIDNFGVERFRLEYENHWTSDCRARGLSVELSHLDADQYDSRSWWCSRRDGGTPGCAPNVPASFSLAISQQAFDPRYETIEIEYTSPPRTNTRLRVYNIEGRLLHTLLDFKSPQEGMLQWDGRIGGKSLPVGMYVLLADMHPGGMSKKKAFAIVRNVR